ncbi:MAG TPA: hypothetical protein VLA36_11030 [Longimicrobiales bacterium]|nr:hypothetical protein [Longimicrobiales bacterium]
MLLHLFSTVLTLGGHAAALPLPNAADSIPAEAAREDILQLGDLLERVHPDPFAGFGGRVAYQRAFQGLLDGVPDGWVQIPDLRRRIAGFLGDMGDGHTGVQQLSSSADEVERWYLPVRFATAADGIIVSDATPEYEELLGARLETVEGGPVDELALDTRVFFPSENISGSRRQLAASLGGTHLITAIAPDVEDSLHLTVTRPGAAAPEAVTLAYSLSPEERTAGPWPMRDAPRVSPASGPFDHRMLADGTVGYLRLRGMWSREAFESMRAAGRTDIDQWLETAYDRFMDRARPADQAEAIESFPSLIDELDALLHLMDDHGTRDLIVDLRENGGGFSIIGEPLLYQLFGGAYLQTPDPVFFATRVSEELLAIQGRSLGEVSDAAGRQVRLGDYTYDPPDPTALEVETLEEFLNRHRANGFSRIGTLADVPSDPALNVVVITDAATFSAAFDLAYQLHRMGGRMLGVPPSQSPRAFTDSTPFVLAHSGLRGSMSRTAVVYPGIPSAGGAVVMDVPLTWSLWGEFDFHPEAPVHAALAELRGTGR